MNIRSILMRVFIDHSTKLEVLQRYIHAHPFKLVFWDMYESLNYLMSISCLKILQFLCGRTCHVVVFLQCASIFLWGNCFLHPWPHLLKLLISNLSYAIIFASFEQRLGDMWNCKNNIMNVLEYQEPRKYREETTYNFGR